MTSPRRATEPAHDLQVHDADGFAPYVDPAATVYGAAMGRAPALVAQRRTIMIGHLERPGFVGVTATSDERLVGFGYGYPGRAGEWWHDVVADALDRPAAKKWLADDFEVAELHVHPDDQGQGLGRRILQTLLDNSNSRTIVLSTHDRESAARALYRSFGFVDLLRHFRFPGSAEVYAILGRER